MKITNKTNLPTVIYNAIQRGWYNDLKVKNAFSATTLLKPNKLYWLSKQYEDVLVEDASDRIWALMGSAMHSVLEKGQEDDAIQECRLRMELPSGILHGSFDHYQNGTVSDFKFTSVWSVVYKQDKMEEWTQQLNLYALLLRDSGFTVTSLQIIAILRDWSKAKSKFTSGYPKEQVVIIPIPLWTKDKQLEYAEFKIAEKQSYKDINVDEIPECSERERWQSPTEYAVKKIGRKSAIKLYTDIDEARAHVANLSMGNTNHYLETREGKPRRCDDYCPVSNFCNWYSNSIFNTK